MSNFTGTIPTVTAGQLVRGAYLAAIGAYATAATDAWTDYTSSFTIGATTTAPTLGSSVKQAQYKQLGKDIRYQFSLAVTIGGSWNAGSGTYKFSLPAAASSTGRWVGAVHVNDSGTAVRVGICEITSADTSNAYIFLNDGTNVALSSSGPGTSWNTGDYVYAEILYLSA